jgi:hypothetical protein
VRRLRAAHPAEPWRWDYVWDERGITDDYARYNAATSIAAIAVLGVFAVAASGFSIAALLSGHRSLQLFAVPFVVVALLLDYAVLRGLFDVARLIAGRLKYGRGVASFDRFPFRRGETLRLHVRAPRALPRHAVVTATLRCVQERLAPVGTLQRQPRIECFELYRDVAPAEVVDAASGARAIRVTFSVPADVPATDFSSYPCRYWEVDVEASTDGVDYAARFVVPVY